MVAALVEDVFVGEGTMFFLLALTIEFFLEGLTLVLVDRRRAVLVLLLFEHLVDGHLVAPGERGHLIGESSNDCLVSSFEDRALGTLEINSTSGYSLRFAHHVGTAKITNKESADWE